MPINFPTFQPGQVPTMQPIQPIQPPPVGRYDPAQIIMQAAQLKQQQRIENQQLAQRQLESLTGAIQTAQSLKLQQTKAEQEHDIAQQTLELHKGELPLQEAQTRLENLKADALAKGIGAPYYTTDQAVLMTLGPNATPEAKKNMKDSLDQMWPNGVVDKSYADQMGMMNRFSLGLTQKSSEFTEQQWARLAEDSPMAKGPRQAIGQAAINQGKLQNVRNMLTKPGVTDDELTQAVENLNSVMSGGAPEENAAKSQLYGTMQSKYNKLITEITATPQAARQPAIQQKLLGMMDDLQNVNSGKLEGYFSSIRASRKSLLTQDPQRYLDWENSTRAAVGLSSGVESLLPNLQTQTQAVQPAVSAQPTQAPLQPRTPINSGLNTLMNAIGVNSPVQQPQQQLPQTPQTGGKIKVRRKSDGSIGLLSQQYMDPNVYDQVP